MSDGSTNDAPIISDTPGTPATTGTGITFTTTTSNGTSTTPTPPQPPALSQDEVNRIAAREKDAGKRAERQALLEALGVKNLDEARAQLQAARDAEDANKSEMQKAIEKAQAEATAAQQLASTLAAERRDLACERALLHAGIADDKQRTALVSLVAREVDADASADVVAAAVETVKATFPQLFTPPTQGNPTPPPSGEPAGGGAPPAPRIADARERGRLRAQKVNGDNATSFDPIKALRQP